MDLEVHSNEKLNEKFCFFVNPLDLYKGELPTSRLFYEPPCRWSSMGDYLVHIRDGASIRIRIRIRE